MVIGVWLTMGVSVKQRLIFMISRFVPILSKLKALKNHGRLMWHAFRHADTPKWIKGMMIAVVVYLISPIDVIPDFALILGLTDDAIVITVAMWFLGQMIPESVRNSMGQQGDLTAQNGTKERNLSAGRATNRKSDQGIGWQKPMLAGLLIGVIILALINADALGLALQKLVQ